MTGVRRETAIAHSAAADTRQVSGDFRCAGEGDVVRPRNGARNDVLTVFATQLFEDGDDIRMVHKVWGPIDGQIRMSGSWSMS